MIIIINENKIITTFLFDGKRTIFNETVIYFSFIKYGQWIMAIGYALWVRERKQTLKEFLIIISTISTRISYWCIRNK